MIRAGKKRGKLMWADSIFIKKKKGKEKKKERGGGWYD